MKGIIREKKFRDFLKQEEKSEATISKYLRDIKVYGEWIESEKINGAFSNEKAAKKVALRYKEYLTDSDLKTCSINTKLASINSYMACIGYSVRLKYIKVQKQHFYSKDKELTGVEYRKLVTKAYEMGNERLALIIETLASTGLRISELEYVTVEGLKARKVQVFLKGKSRVVYLPMKLCVKLHEYVFDHEIEEGPIFRTSHKTPVSRKQIWREMKGAAEAAEIEYTKVFPHNMRHVFAKTYYRQFRDISTLANILGHSSLETTRIYIASSRENAEKQIDSLAMLR